MSIRNTSPHKHLQFLLLFLICCFVCKSTLLFGATWTETQKSDWQDGLTNQTTYYPEAQLQLDWSGSGTGISSPTAGFGWLSGWNYRRQISITNAGSALTDYQIFIPTGTGANQINLDVPGGIRQTGKCQSTLADFRFVSSTGAVLNYWIEDNTTTPKGLWIRCGSLPNGTTYVWMYYGNASVPAAQSGDTTFLLFDNFNGTSINTNKWNTYSGNSTLAINSGVLAYTTTGGHWGSSIINKSIRNWGISVKYRWKPYGASECCGGSTQDCGYGSGLYIYNEYPVSRDTVYYYAPNSSTVSKFVVRRSNNNLNIDCPSGNINLSSWNTNWHEFEIRIKPDKSFVYLVDGQQKATGVISTTNNNFYLDFCNNNYYDSPRYDLDDILVRKYAAIEPTVSSIGNEEGQYYTNGNYKSNVLNTGYTGENVTNVYWNPSGQPVGTGLNIYGRASNTSFNSEDSSPAWMEVLNGSAFEAAGKYIQYRADFATSVSTLTPVLDYITLTYGWVDLPTGLSGAANSPTQITWNWQDNSSAPQEDGFKIYDTMNNLKGSVGSNSISYPESGLAANTQYTRYIQAYTANASSNSASISKYTLPAVPTNSNITCDKEVSSTYGTSLFTFSTTFGQGSFEYLKYKWDTSEADSDWEETWTGGLLTLSALAQNTSYYLHLKAYNGDDEANATTLVKGPYLYQSAYQSATDTTDTDFGYGLVKSSVTVKDTGSASYLVLNNAMATGTGADGTVTIAGNKNINTDFISGGRSYADGINYTVNAIGSNFVTCSAVPNGIVSGDEVILINQQGNSSYYGNVGKYEFLRVNNISSNSIYFTTNIQKIYGASSSNGDLSGQKITVQRVPNWDNVTINFGYTLTCEAWNGTKGGLLVFRANGTVTINGSIDVSGKGYRGADSTAISNQVTGLVGEGFKGGYGNRTNVLSPSGSNGGSGGGWNNEGTEGAGGAGGSYGTSGERGYDWSSNNPNNSVPGAVIGNPELTQLYMGGGAGSGSTGNGDCGTPGSGGDGGGIIILTCNMFNTSSGYIKSSGINGTNSTWCGGSWDYGTGSGGGGGAGGSIYVAFGEGAIGSERIISNGGTYGLCITPSGSYCEAARGGIGGSGRIRLDYQSLTGATNPTHYAGTTSGYYTSGEFQSRAIDTGGLGTRWGQISWGGVFPAGTSIKTKVRTGDTETPDGSWSLWYPEDEWYTVNSGTPIGTPRARYIQYISSFTTLYSTNSPQLDYVDIQYATNTAVSPDIILPGNDIWLSSGAPVCKLAGKFDPLIATNFNPT